MLLYREYVRDCRDEDDEEDKKDKSKERKFADYFCGNHEIDKLSII